MIAGQADPRLVSHLASAARLAFGMTMNSKGKPMMGRMAGSLAMAFMVFSVFCTTLIAQTPGTGSAGPGKTYELLPGLDKRLIDKTADTCTDFFQYACGNFTKLYPIPSDRSAFGTGAMIAEYTQNVLYTMLEKAAAGGAGRTPNEQKIGDAYAACMDVDAINQRG
jgi:putative endopeptidase